MYGSLEDSCWVGEDPPVLKTTKGCDLAPILALNHIWFSICFTDDPKGVISLRKLCTLKVLYAIFDFTNASKYHNLFADI